MNAVAKTLMMSGALLILAGVLFWCGSKLGMGKLPGDIVIKKENFRFYFPIGTSILLSLVLSLVFYFLRFLNK